MSKRTLFALFALVALVFGSVVYAAPQGQGDNQRLDFVSGEIIVKFKGGEAPFQLVQVARGQEMQAVQTFQQRPDVVYAEPNYIVQALGSNDTYYDNQWALNNTGQTVYRGCNEPGCNLWTAIGSGTADADVDWEEGWNGYSTAFFSDAVVAIVDSGIDDTHPDLSGKLWNNSGEIAGNGIDDDGNGFIDDVWGWDFVQDDNIPRDVYGHGTHVGGIAGAETDNAIGIAGVAFPAEVKIMTVRVLNDDGFGSTSDVALGIRYAADNGAKAINLSLGRRRDTNTMRAAVNYAWNKGVVLAAAAGNDGGGAKYYPASYPNVMSVAATDYNDNTASFSNFNSEVDISAPGVNVFSTFPTYDFTIGTKYGRSKNYDVGSGTSMSTPHVAGLAALLFAQDSTRDNTTVRSIIEGSADDLGSPGWDRHYGWGIINVATALGYTPASPDPTVSVGLTTDKSTYESDVDTIATLTAVVIDENGSAISSLSSSAFNTTLNGSPIVATFTETATLGTYTADLDISALSDGSYTVETIVTDTRSISGSDTATFEISSGGNGGNKCPPGWAKKGRCTL